MIPVLIMSALLASEPAAPPVARKVPKILTLHGDNRTDEYYWLREKTNPDVIAHLEAENRYTGAVMKPSEALQENLYNEILGRIKETDLSVPSRIDDYLYYYRTEQGKQYPIHIRRRAKPEGPEEVTLDLNELAKGLKYFRLGVYAVNPSHKLLAYSTDISGDEKFTLFVKDLSAGKLLEDRIPNTSYSAVWAEDGKTIFYTTLDAARRTDKVWRHRLGTRPEQDQLVYQEKDERFYVDVRKTRSRKYLFISTASAVTSELRYLEADRPDGEFRLIEPRTQGVDYEADHHGKHFYIRVDDKGKNYRLVTAPVDKPSKANWREIAPHRDDVYLEHVYAFRNHLVTLQRERGLRRLRIEDFRSRQAHYIEFAEPVYTAAPIQNPEFDTNLLRFQYTSLITPASVFDYDMDTRKRDLKKQTEVLGGYNPSLYAMERVWAKAPDGAEVPISLVYRKPLERDGGRPLLLYGYGSYGAPSEPYFSSNYLSLLDRNFIYAVAHVRGGAEMGRLWHDAGKMLSKKNTFTDFIAAAEHLVNRKYTSSDRLAIEGGSAGGLLMGAVVNMRPDLFTAVIAKVPFVDIVTTELDPSLPGTVIEWEEWGDPNKKEFYDYIKSYSPYDNVREAQYPHMLITGGLNDPRVSYWEPAKWTAKLRAMKKGNNLLLLKMNMGAGHFGASGRYERLKETAFEYAFMLQALGIDR
jgi:oligopeptidase B